MVVVVSRGNVRIPLHVPGGSSSSWHRGWYSTPRLFCGQCCCRAGSSVQVVEHKDMTIWC